jgi:circadian clock protein KaiC
MAHSNQIREFLLTERGIELTADHGLGEVLTGSARLAEEARLGHDSSNGGAR